jgi:hypothetical membrane protein
MEKTFTGLLALTGAGALCTGLFPETTGTSHIISALSVFICGGACALYSVKVFRPPWSWISFALGTVSLAALILLAGKCYFSLGFGGMERLVAYPLVIWAFGTGGYLMGEGRVAPGPGNSPGQK